MSDMVLRLDNVTMQFGGVVSVNNLTLDVPKGQIIALIGPKHKGEQFLIAKSDSGNSDSMSRLFEEQQLSYQTAVFVKSVSQDLSGLKLDAYDLVVLYNASDVKSLKENFPDFQQGKLKFITYGKTIVNAMEEAGLEIAVKAPSPEIPSVAKAIEVYLQEK